jgi:ABC-type transport system involved in cytochrome c biogenesis permease subunit
MEVVFIGSLPAHWKIGSFQDNKGVTQSSLEAIMENQATATAPASQAPRRWPLFFVGVLLFIAGPAIYVMQVRSGHLPSPWYVPVLATVGVALMAISVLQRRGILRIVGLVLFVLVCGFEWAGVLMRTPPYTGPAQTGKVVPAFETNLADGRAFSNKDLENGTPTVLLFFRGRW